MEQQNSTSGQGKTGLWTNQRAIIAFLLGLIIGAALMWLWVWLWGTIIPPDLSVATGREQLENGENRLPSSSAPSEVSRTGNRIVVSDQFPGTIVEVDMVTLSQSGWVVVHENLDGSVGNALGAGWFDRGEHSGEVELLRGTIAGGTYYAILYHDEEDDHLFELGKDLPLVDEEGAQIRATFVATPPPPAAGD